VRSRAAARPTNDGPLYPTDPLAVEAEAGPDARPGPQHRHQRADRSFRGRAQATATGSGTTSTTSKEPDQKTVDRDDRRPLAGTDAASAPPCSGFTRRGDAWLPGTVGPGTADRTAAPGRGLIG
jgi:hypothetical protein